MGNNNLIHQQTKMTPYHKDYNSYFILPWKQEDTHDIYLLEKKCWAPWLQKSEKDFMTIATRFSELQRLIKNDKGKIVASMTVNRINWSGDPKNIPTWDEIAGGGIGTGNFINTYIPNGNTLCLMSMNVQPNEQGKGLAQKLLEELRFIAKKNKVKYIISSIRPVSYGNYKLKQIEKTEPVINFSKYCRLKNEKKEPYDPWIRSANRKGIKILHISKNAIVVKVDIKTFKHFMNTYNPLLWKRLANKKWECGETGNWTVYQDSAIYSEDNLSVEILID